MILNKIKIRKQAFTGLRRIFAFNEGDWKPELFVVNILCRALIHTSPIKKAFKSIFIDKILSNACQ